MQDRPVLAFACPQQVDRIDVEMGPPGAGWISIRMPQFPDFRVAATYLVDPFGEMIAWLEAIVAGTRSAAWHVDEEGSSAHFLFVSDASNWAGGYDDHLLITYLGGQGRHYAAAQTTRRAVVTGFYAAFRAMVDAPDYIPREWESGGPEPELDKNDPASAAIYDAWEQDTPYDGLPLRNMRSAVIEAYLDSSVAEKTVP